MISFDFAALLTFLMSLFEAFRKLGEKLGFKPGGTDKPEGDESQSEQESSSEA